MTERMNLSNRRPVTYNSPIRFLRIRKVPVVTIVNILDSIGFRFKKVLSNTEKDKIKRNFPAWLGTLPKCVLNEICIRYERGVK